VASLPALVAGAVAGTGVTYLASGRLETAADRLASHYGVPAIVQGAVIAAVGSSMPEIAAVVLSTLLHGSFDLGVGSIVGSAVFNLLVIPALAALSAGGPLETNRTLVYKEAQFYMLAVAALTLTFALAVIYDPAAGELRGRVTRPLALAPVALYGLYVFIQYADTVAHDGTTQRADAVLREWARLAGSLVAIVIGVELLVRAAVGFGATFGTSSFLWGVTVVAAGTSLPDAFVSLAAARDGESAVSLANVLGSNVFDLLVAVPTGVLLAGAATVNFARITPMMAFLVVATVAFFAATRTDLRLGRVEAAGLLGLYVLFVAWMVAEAAGLVTLL
jgi:cation:H+ antiporter